MADLSTARRSPRVDANDIVRPLPRATRFVLRGGEAALNAAGAALDLSLSRIACRSATRGDWAALWLGPDEQLLLAPEAEASDLSRRLGEALRDIPHSLVDVGHRQIALEVSGPHVRTVLNAGCPLDLDSAVFPVGACTRTMLGKVEIVLWHKHENVFRLEVFRSFTAYVSKFLAAAQWPGLIHERHGL